MPGEDAESIGKIQSRRRRITRLASAALWPVVVENRDVSVRRANANRMTSRKAARSSRRKHVSQLYRNGSPRAQIDIAKPGPGRRKSRCEGGGRRKTSTSMLRPRRGKRKKAGGERGLTFDVATVALTSRAEVAIVARRNDLG